MLSILPSSFGARAVKALLDPSPHIESKGSRRGLSLLRLGPYYAWALLFT